MRLLGLLFKISYLFSRYYLMGIRLDTIGVGLLLATAVLSFRGNLPLWGTLSLVATCIVIVFIAFAQRTGYILFRLEPGGELEVTSSPLPADTRLSLFASGVFGVRDQRQRLVDHPTIYSTPRSREHILMAKQYPSGLMGIVRLKEDNWGWWYQFIKPEAIVSVDPGTAIHGWRPQRAIRIRYREEGEGRDEITTETILSFDNNRDLERVWEDLTREKRGHPATR